MNTPQSFRAVSALLLAFSFNASADEITRLEIRRTGPRLEINWPAIVEKSVGSIMQRYFELHCSVDLQQWQPIVERQLDERRHGYQRGHYPGWYRNR